MSELPPSPSGFPDEQRDNPEIGTPLIIEGMSADAVLAMWHRATDETGASRPLPGEPDSEEILAQIELLPGRNIEHAQGVFSIFVNSTRNVDRRHIAWYISALTEVDRLYGLPLWEQLMCDPDHEVRIAAYNPLESTAIASNTPDQQDKPDLTDLGITWRDAYGLMRAFVRAEIYEGATHTPGMPPYPHREFKYLPE
ncbi:hypothetical protein [Parafrankia sp. FMc2]|uniref:hypothetical protein n=1 Tax=Parafrankia sp. FMc2 TaxID=3233196 RepID=UPI0034D61F67